MGVVGSNGRHAVATVVRHLQHAETGKRAGHVAGFVVRPVEGKVENVERVEPTLAGEPLQIVIAILAAAAGAVGEGDEVIGEVVEVTSFAPSGSVSSIRRLRPS